MKQWYFFTPTDNTDISDPHNYTLIPKDQYKDNHQYKLYAILADDNGSHQPIIDELELNIDFMRSVQERKNVGMVILNKQFLKKENWFNKFIDKLITYI
ncbi:hypothetical protein QG516_07715 [Pedobacter gandavensis]|uniref:hypothetical protein n=1 Tax=Pedobacter gandavensis TaxID=2679963 RepID=UPI00247B18EC|nr:hypothetical protein [Pedobacter gandavensis]WGQ11541.1 hypothetical protein QG516_07715 [Pedobacter gandavensis]